MGYFAAFIGGMVLGLIAGLWFATPSSRCQDRELKHLANQAGRSATKLEDEADKIRDLGSDPK